MDSCSDCKKTNNGCIKDTYAVAPEPESEPEPEPESGPVKDPPSKEPDPSKTGK